MLLKGYQKEIIRPECNPSFESVHCIAQLDQDIGPVLPYLNTILGGTSCSVKPPSLTLKAHGKLITLHARKIAINALEDDREAERILRWLVKEINEAWENRDRIEPSYGAAPRPKILEILKRLPKTNCGKCGQPTCMVFASVAAEGGMGPERCPELDEERKEDLRDYLAQFPMARS